MSEMIERVAKALHNSGVFPLGDMREYLSDEAANILARAAIEAMGEPTENMVQGAFDKCGYSDGMNWSSSLKNHYRAMIDASLK